MQYIIESFLSFRKEISPQRKEFFRGLAPSQNPKTLFTFRSDSRLVPELVTQQDLGQLFIIHNAGNIVLSFGPESGGVSAIIKHVVVTLGVTDIVIYGHSNCGATKAITDSQPLDPVSAVARWPYYADAAKAVVDKKAWGNPINKVNAMVEENVTTQLNNIKTHPCVAVGSRNSALRLYSWVYNIESDEIRTLDKNSRTYVSLTDNPRVHSE